MKINKESGRAIIGAGITAALDEIRRRNGMKDLRIEKRSISLALLDYLRGAATTRRLEKKPL